MRRFPEPIQQLMAAFSRLPGVGPKTALRYVYHVLKQPSTEADLMARALQQLHSRTRLCPECFAYTETETCEICHTSSRDRGLLCVVEESRDIATIESTDVYKGLYHVLGGLLNPMDGVTAETLRVRELLEHVRASSALTEIILALPSTIQGETTSLYLIKRLSEFPVRITRLARGLPVGASLEYADDVTLGSAIQGRQQT